MQIRYNESNSLWEYRLDPPYPDTWAPLPIDIAQIVGSVGGSGDVVGPAVSSHETIPLWDGTTGKLLKDSGVNFGDVGLLVANNSWAGQNDFSNTPTTTLVDQLEFSATQANHAGANVLDDYEEGSWTPIVGGAGGESGQTYGVQVGRYTKIGNLVFASFYVTGSNKGTITGAVRIKGLPFICENVTSGYQSGQMQYWNTATSFYGMNMEGIINSASFDVYGWAAAAAATGSILTSDLNTVFGFLGNMTYRTTT